MSRGRIRRAGQALASACLTVAALAIAAAPAHAVSPRSCGWVLQVSGDQVNALYPDDSARYWIAILPIPPGGHAELRGRYPHARYLSIHTYTPATQAIDALADVEIEPDRGSRNPFLPGAARTVRRRNYTVRIVNERLPEGRRAQNTLYTETADGSKSSKALGLAGIALRVYEPDLGRDVSGGVGLPRLSVVTATGRRTTLPACPDTALPDAGFTPALAQASLPLPLGRFGLLGHDPPRWSKYTNIVTAQSSFVVNSQALSGSIGDRLSALADARLPSGGSGENLHNKYIYTTFSREFGEVLVLRGRMPSTPSTRQGQRRMADGQLRYWSLCTNAQITSYYACRNDHQVPVDGRGRFTIAVSAANARPRNARDACGIAWLPAGPSPQSVLIVRNMLAASDFPQAIQHVDPGRERQGMGDYYPTGRYYRTTAAAEEALGCDG